MVASNAKPSRAPCNCESDSCQTSKHGRRLALPVILASIPPKPNRNDADLPSVAYLYRARNLVERFFNKIKQCRRIATRYDKLAADYLAFVKLASIRLWLRAYEFTP